MIRGRRHRSGGINYVTVILLLVIASVVAGVYCYFPPYYAEFTLKRAAEGKMIQAAEISDEDIRQEMMKVAERTDIPLGSGEIQVSRYSNTITVEYKYTRPVPLSFLPPFKAHETLKRDIKKVEHLFNKPLKK